MQRFRITIHIVIVPVVLLYCLFISEIDDVPLDVRTRLCHQLDANYGSLTEGRVKFGVKMGLAEVKARRAEDTNAIMLNLQTKCVKLDKVFTALISLGRQDAINGLLEWMQGNAQQ